MIEGPGARSSKVPIEYSKDNPVATGGLLQGSLFRKRDTVWGPGHDPWTLYFSWVCSETGVRRVYITLSPLSTRVVDGLLPITRRQISSLFCPGLQFLVSVEGSSSLSAGPTFHANTLGLHHEKDRHRDTVHKSRS